MELCVGQKGSDVSAREATKKLVAATKQMHALQAVLQVIHDAVNTDKKSHSADESARCAAAEAGPWAAKNTIVRDVLNELTNLAQKTRKTRMLGVSDIGVNERRSPDKYNNVLND